MLLGYKYISEADDESVRDAQHQALLDAGVPASNIYSDMDTEQESKRPQLEACLNALNAGDRLIVWRLDFLIDSRVQFQTILQDLLERDAGFKVLAGPGVVFDTAHINLKLAIDIVAALNDLETQILRRRTLAAHAVARQRGQVLGGQRKMTASMLKQAITALAESDLSMTAIATQIGVTRATLYNYLNGDGSLKPTGKELLSETED
ncbi:recombinase family protein [Leptothoe sp. LEGE 181152]|nr:recombinase family protein [Leptothoe sp. LEGE 181152]